jgi:hypothetical protein
MNASLELKSYSSHKVVVVEGWVVGEPDATPPTQLPWHMRTSAAAMMVVVQGIDGYGWKTHVVQPCRERIAISKVLEMLFLRGVVIDRREANRRLPAVETK